MERRYMIEIYNRDIGKSQNNEIKKEPAKFTNKKEFKAVMEKKIKSGEVERYKLTERDKEIIKKAGL